MITTLEHGVTVDSAAEGAIVQNLDVEEKQEESALKGMSPTDGTQIVKVWGHSKTLDFSTTGSGDLTLATGTGYTSTNSLVSGGVTAVWSFKYTQKLGEPSQWTYTGKNYPYAS